MLTRDLVLNVLKAHANDWWTNARMRHHLIAIKAERSSSAIRHAFMTLGRLSLVTSQKHATRTQWSEWKLSPTVFQGAALSHLFDLEVACETIIKEHVDAKKSFSAHDITKALREAVNEGRITVDPTNAGTVHVNGKDVTKIDHNLVRTSVHAKFDSGAIPGYDRVDNGNFQQYVPTPVAVVSSDPSTVPPPADPNVQPYNGTPTL